MIKATMICTNCKREKDIPREELDKAILDDNVGELNLCTDCSELWKIEMATLRGEQATKFKALQKRFGIKE